MCGITGIFNLNGEPVSPVILRKMTDVLAHRGPDGEGFYTNGGLGLGHRRLAIIDLSPAGRQPMATADGQYVLTYNGEIYNFQELRRELEALGYQFRSRTDAEVLLYAYAEWGAAVLTRLNGMFAFAIFNGIEKKLFLARDFFGIKPLYYIWDGTTFAFASEIKALLALPGVARRVHPRRLFDYLCFGLTDHGAETLFADVRQLPAAHHMEVCLQEGGVGQPQRYWHVDLQQRTDLSFGAAAAQVRELFLQNVRFHLRSDVPVGSCLSGGIDSSSIVLAMRQLEGPTLVLHPFSAVFADAVIGEEKFVDMAARAASAVSHKTRPTAQELVTDLDHLVYMQDEPFGSTSIYAQQRVFRLAGEHGIKVVLDGQGADEMFAGYRPALSARLAALVKQLRWLAAWRLLNAAADLPGSSRQSMLNGMRGFLLSPGMLAWARRRVPGGLPAWINFGWFAAHGVDGGRPLRTEHGHDALRDYLLYALEATSLPMLLRYEDRNSMSHSIESRVPFLTPALVEFVLSLPEEYIVSPSAESKTVLRAALRGLTPDPILARKDKIGFATPEQHWLQTLKPWVDETLHSVKPAHLPGLKLGEAAKEWALVAAGSKSFDWRIWRWINVIRWMELYRINCEV